MHSNTVEPIIGLPYHFCYNRYGYTEDGQHSECNKCKSNLFTHIKTEMLRINNIRITVTCFKCALPESFRYLCNLDNCYKESNLFTYKFTI